MIASIFDISLSLAYWLVAGIYVLSIIGTIIVILSENRNPVKSLAWVTVLVMVPLLGIVLYIVFGRSIKNTRMISRRNRRKLRKKETYDKVKFSELDLSAESVSQIMLGRRLSGAVYYPGNKVQVFVSGREMLDAFLLDIERAQAYINMQFYIFQDDEVGYRVKDALIAAAARGVAVRVIYDHVGSFKTKNRFFKDLIAAGVQAYPFFRVAFPSIGTRINWRNHRKIAVIDGNAGYIGGMNIADRYITGGDFASWRDTHLRIEGPAVSGLQYSFAVDWNFMGQPFINDEVNRSIVEPGGAGMQLLTSGPTSQWSNIAMLFVKAIAGANKRVYIQTPYFLPTDALLRALQASALAGVDVRVMMPERSDSAMLDAASHSYISECLQAGIKIYFYKAGMLHAKMLLADDEMVSIGSTNFDFRSFEHNFEANMQIYSKEFNEKMAETFRADIELSERVSPAAWRKRPLLKKTFESIVRLLSPIL